MKVSVFSPVKNEVEFIGYSLMAILPYVHEVLYGLAKSDDGTEDLLFHIKDKYDPDGKIKLFKTTPEINFDFDPLNVADYNASYNYLLKQATGDALWFLHPDMIVTNPEQILKMVDGPLAWITHLTSFARDAATEIRGRAGEWKNIHANRFGLHYFGGYGSQNEDMYFKDITGQSYRHYGTEFENYPFEIADSFIQVNHYCELKSYKRRLEKMKSVLRTLHPKADDGWILENASHHPRVTLESTSERFGKFSFEPSKLPMPEVFTKFRTEFEPFKTRG